MKQTTESNPQRRRREMRIHGDRHLVLIAMVLALGAAPVALDGQEAAVITGRVTNAQTNDPQANATVTIRIPGDMLRATTSATGAYVIRGVPAGSHTITVNARGAAPQTRTLRVAPPGTVRADFVLEPAAARRPQTQAPARQLQAVRTDGDPDIRVASPRSREGFRNFWASLPRGEAAALDRRLTGLDSLFRRDGDVDRDLAAIRRQHPELFRLSAALQRETWNLVGPGGVDEGSVECNGLGWIGINGKVRCIGKLVVSD
jgi:hypothetical protein